jgi:hypothetical protein
MYVSIVIMVVRIAYDIRFLLVVLFCVLAGFAQGFWLLSNIDKSLPFGTVNRSLLTSFMYMLGQDISAEFDGTVAPEFASFLLIMFLLFMMILMLNLLIALIGEIFSKVRDESTVFWRREQALLFLDQSHLLPNPNSTHEFIHVLKYTSDVDLAGTLE